MSRLTKRRKEILKKINLSKQYSIIKAFDLLKSLPKTKFNENIDISIKLGIDIRKANQLIRGSTILPNGIGKDVKIAVFASGEMADIAKKSGADIIGMEDLALKLKKEKIDFDVIIASPDAMHIVSPLGQILGPKGLMPNPKTGTVTLNIAETIKNIKLGQIRYRSDKTGVINCGIGKMNFSSKALYQNLETLILDMKKIKPSNIKGTYFKKISVSSTMGPGLTIDLASLSM